MAKSIAPPACVMLPCHGAQYSSIGGLKKNF